MQIAQVTAVRDGSIGRHYRIMPLLPKSPESTLTPKNGKSILKKSILTPKTEKYTYPQKRKIVYAFRSPPL